MQLIDPAPLMHFPHTFRLRWHERILHFKRPATTSRGALITRRTFIIETITASGSAFGECCTMPGLLPAPTPEELDCWCTRVEAQQGLSGIVAPSPIQFGMECALLGALHPGKPRWNSPQNIIPIHHLIWMDSAENMLAAMQQGVEAGFRCLKLKVGALSFDEELDLLHQAHATFPAIEIRVDANGTFRPGEANRKLELLAAAGVSSIEQPIRPGQWEALAQLCRTTALAIALDEELINQTDAAAVLDAVQPQAIVIKPSLHGGLLAAQNWAQEAEARGIRWWVNSALESHIGLTALAEWCAYAAPGIMQGLGTGLLFTDDSPDGLRLEAGALHLLAN